MKPDQVPMIGITSPGKWINLAGVYRGKKGDEATANARLIAASPTLYAALRRMLDNCPFHVDVNSCECGPFGNGFDEGDKPCEHIEAARALALVEKD